VEVKEIVDECVQEIRSAEILRTSRQVIQHRVRSLYVSRCAPCRAGPASEVSTGPEKNVPRAASIKPAPLRSHEQCAGPRTGRQDTWQADVTPRPGPTPMPRGRLHTP